MEFFFVPVASAGRGRGRVKLQHQEAQVGRGQPQEVQVGRGQPQEVPTGRGQPPEAAVGEAPAGRGMGRVYSSEGSGDGAVGRRQAQQFQGMLSIKLDKISKTKIIGRCRQPHIKRGVVSQLTGGPSWSPADGFKSASGTTTPLPSTISASRASTPHKSGPVMPMSTPGMSAGLSWSTTPEKSSSDDASGLSVGISRISVKEPQLLPPQKRRSRPSMEGSLCTT